MSNQGVHTYPIGEGQGDGVELQLTRVVNAATEIKNGHLIRNVERVQNTTVSSARDN